MSANKRGMLLSLYRPVYSSLPNCKTRSQSCYNVLMNTNPGIAPEHRERIFDRFVRVETGLKTRGFGLGLAYCCSAVRAHGGRIWVEGGDGGTGTKFLFTLPL